MINEFTELSGVTLEELFCDSRSPRIVCARQLYWKLLKEKGRLTYRDIKGKSNRDMATISEGLKRVNGLLDTGDELATSMWDKVKHLNYTR